MRKFEISERVIDRLTIALRRDGYVAWVTGATTLHTTASATAINTLDRLASPSAVIYKRGRCEDAPCCGCCD